MWKAERQVQWTHGFSSRMCVCVSVRALETVSLPDSAGRLVSLLTADEMECLLTQRASASRAPLSPPVPDWSARLHWVSQSPSPSVCLSVCQSAPPTQILRVLLFLQDFRILCTQKNEIYISIYIFFTTTWYYTFCTPAGPLALGNNASKCSCRMSHNGDEYQWAVFFIFHGGVTVTMQERAGQLRRRQLVGASAQDDLK